ncbi:MAG: hypothetical protein DMG65_12270 [Candidatus Angelobacter sp. Gp1-AA117]|nr:MAG: hypothetical protein DMG65_12270 [Candidatus Angelobacter sp. Gp1-AA117]
MSTESAIPEFELSIDHFSYDALQRAKWADLERFAVEVLRRYYEPFGLSLHRTEKKAGSDVGGDGAHDGEATVILGGSSSLRQNIPTNGLVLPTELGIFVTLWVEVKKRSSENVDHHDLGGTLFRSSLEHVTKLVFVCNRDFTRQFREDLGRYANRYGVQFALIDGKTLIRIAEEVTSSVKPTSLCTADTEKPEIKAQLRFTTDQFYRCSKTTGITVSEHAVGEPIFVEAECRATEFVGIYKGLRANLEYDGRETLQISSRLESDHSFVGVGDQFRVAFMVYTDHSCTLSLSSFSIKITNDEGQPVLCSIIRETGICHVRGTLLPDWIPPSRVRQHHNFLCVLQEWMLTAKPCIANVISIAGIGKTHLIRSIRRFWLNHGVYEVYLDGAVDQTPNAVALAILGQIFPVPLDQISSTLADTLTEWLIRSGLSKPEASAFAHCVVNKDVRELPFSHSQFGQFLALMLANFSARNQTIIIFEDLHKCLPTVMTMLQGMQRGLLKLGSVRVFTLLTTREDSVWDDEALRIEWRNSFGELRVSSDAKEFHLHGFNPEEALEMLRVAIPEIEEYHSQEIISQVGTTPFGIREAMGLLVELKALEPGGEKNGTWRLLYPEQMIRSLDSQELRRPTHYRLKGLQERYPDWLSDFLATGACISIAFDPMLCAQNAGCPSGRALEQALAECRALEVIRFSPIMSSEVQFDHDLVRHVLLEDMGQFQQRKVAKSLLERIAEYNNLPLLSSLAYQAGMADDCWRYALKHFEVAQNAHHHLEAVQALALALAVTDQNIATNVFAVQSGRYRPSFDEAISVATPVLRSLDRSTRERATADLLLQYIEQLVAVGSGGSTSIAKALTEAGMFAERLKDSYLSAMVKMYQGRQEFNRENISESLQLHQAAEAVFSDLPKSATVIEKRCLNLVRLAIVQRQCGQLGQSRATLIKAAKLTGNHWELLAQIRANFGATYFYTNWSETRRHWSRALKIAARGGTGGRYIHTLIDLAHLDLLEDKLDSAVKFLEDGLILSRQQGLENSELRCLLNLGCAALMQNASEQALHLLRDADRLGFRHEIGRRLWRVRSNMATAHFLLGDIPRSLVADQMTLRSIPLVEKQVFSLKPDHPSAGTRMVLAIANIALRAEHSPTHTGLLRTLPDSAQRSAIDLATMIMNGQQDLIPGLRGRHCKKIGAYHFFIITE